MPTVELEIRSAASAPDPLVRLREGLIELLDAGMPREELYAILDRLRLQYRAEGDESLEDIVMEAMDLFNGWAHSSLRI